MNGYMICRQKRHQIKRFWFCQKRVFVVPVRKAIRSYTSDRRSETPTVPE